MVNQFGKSMERYPGICFYSNVTCWLRLYDFYVGWFVLDGVRKGNSCYQETWHCPQAGLLVAIRSLLSELGKDFQNIQNIQTISWRLDSRILRCFCLGQSNLVENWPSANIRRTLGLCEIAQAHVVWKMNLAKSLYTSKSRSSSFCSRSGVPSSSTSSVNNLELPVTKKTMFWGFVSIINTPT